MTKWWAGTFFVWFRCDIFETPGNQVAQIEVVVLQPSDAPPRPADVMLGPAEVRHRNAAGFAIVDADEEFVASFADIRLVRAGAGDAHLIGLAAMRDARMRSSSRTSSTRPGAACADASRAAGLAAASAIATRSSSTATPATNRCAASAPPTRPNLNSCVPSSAGSPQAGRRARSPSTSTAKALIPGVLPFSLDPELRKIARPLFKQSEAIGETEMIIWAVRKPFIDKNRAAMVDFMEDTLRIVRWYLDPANQKAAAEIAAKVTKQPVERFGWVFTDKDYYRDPNMLPNLEALQKNLDMTTDLGFVKAKVDVAKHVDLSIVKEAAARIK